MKLAGKACVVTGGANGIGRALCEAFAREGAQVVVADRDAALGAEVAASIGGTFVAADVSREEEVASLVARALELHGRIDLFASNAGLAISGGPETPDSGWQQSWDVNVMAHVWAARHVLPAMLARGEGYLLATASAAGLLTSLGAAPYAVTKHAAVAFAEWLSMTYGDRGIGVSCLCPQGVRTGMLAQAEHSAVGRAIALAGAVLEPAQVADFTVRALAERRFLILPHPEAATYMQRRAQDHERWLSAMRSLNTRLAQ